MSNRIVTTVKERQSFNLMIADTMQAMHHSDEGDFEEVDESTSSESSFGNLINAVVQRASWLFGPKQCICNYSREPLTVAQLPDNQRLIFVSKRTTYKSFVFRSGSAGMNCFMVHTMKLNYQVKVLYLSKPGYCCYFFA
jgi:hypothetical protein